MPSFYSITTRYLRRGGVWNRKFVSTLLISIVLIVVKLKFHPFLALLLASFSSGR